MAYYRPLPLPPEAGGLPLAGGWLRFQQIELLSRDAAPRIIPATDAPAEVLDRLTASRPDLMGLPMDRVQVMGIVNVTPDSFSDGGLWAHRDDAIAHGRHLVAAGASILDIGGETTKPGAPELPVADENARVLPVIESLAGVAPVSVDTRKAAVARDALAAGARLVNDVSGYDFDPDMAATVAAAGAEVCLMHAQGLPENMQDAPSYGNVLLDVYDALEARVARAEAAGTPRALICTDPGIGFGKTLAHNLAILRRLSLFHAIGCPILLGISRKTFIGKVAGVDTPAERVPGTIAATLYGIGQGAQIHRVHDVAAIVQATRLWQAIGNAD